MKVVQFFVNCMLKYKVVKGYFSLSFISFNYDKYGQN